MFEAFDLQGPLEELVVNYGFLAMRHFYTKMVRCAVQEILVNLYSMLGISWNSIALGLNESSFWPYDYHFTHTVFPHIVSAETILFLFRKSK